MDDTLKTVIFGFLGMIVFHASLEKRAQHDATRQVSASFRNTGSIRAVTEPRGMFGALANHFYAVDIYGTGQSTEHLPFLAFPREGWKGHIRHLRLHFNDLTLKGLPVSRFEADIPNVTYDLGQALYKDRLVIRGAGTGPATVTIGAEGLKTFILKKYGRSMREIQIGFADHKVVISGRILLLGAQSPFVAIGELVERDGRYVDLTRTSVDLNGKPLAPEVAASMLKQINPVLDIATDLDLADYLKITHVSIGAAEITVFGQASIPIAKPGQAPVPPIP
jgi:hypothetical protein